MGDRNLTAMFFFTPSPRRRRPPSSPVARLLVPRLLATLASPRSRLFAGSLSSSDHPRRTCGTWCPSVAGSLERSDLPRCSFCTCPRVSALSALFPRPFSCPARRNLSPSDRLGRSGCRHLPGQPRGVRAVVSGLCRLCRLCRRRRGFAGTLSRSARIDRRCDTSRRLCRRLCRRRTRLCRPKTREYPPTRKTSPCGQTRRIGCIAYRSSVALENPATRSLSPSGQSFRICCTCRWRTGLSRTRRHRLRCRTQPRRLGCYPDSRAPCFIVKITQNIQWKREKKLGRKENIYEGQLPQHTLSRRLQKSLSSARSRCSHQEAFVEIDDKKRRRVVR
jgi:hypothetical protein